MKSHSEFSYKARRSSDVNAALLIAVAASVVVTAAAEHIASAAGEKYKYNN